MRIISVIVALSFCISLASCIANSDDQDVLTDPSLVITPTSTHTLDRNQTSNRALRTITVAMSDLEQGVYAPLVQRFHTEHPDIVVQFVTHDGIFPDGADTDREQARLADVSIVSFSRSFATRRGNEGIWLDVQPFMNADAQFGRTDFYTGTLQAVSDANHTYALPLTRAFNLVAYNKDVWEAANLPPPAQDWTWNELRAAAAQIAQRAPKNRKVYGWLNAENYYEALLAGLQAQGIDALSTSVDALRIDDPRYIQSIEQIAQLEQSGGIYTPALANGATNFSAIDAAISSHQVALFSSLWLRPNTKLRIGFAPSFLRGTRSENSLRSFVISSGTRHPDAAWKLIAFLSKNEPGSPFPFHHGIMPARKSVAERLGYWQTRSPDEVAALQTMLNRPVIDPMQGDSLLATVGYAADAVQAIVKKEQPPQRAAAEAQRAFEQAHAQIPTPTAPSPPIAVNTPVPVAVAAATRITFSAAGIDASTMEALVQRFQTYKPTITVVRTLNLAATDSPFLRTANTTDCFVIPSLPTTPAERAALLDLQPLADADARFPRTDYPAAVLARLTQNGRVTGLPLQLGLPALHANPAVLARAGIATPGRSWSLDPFRAAAQQATNGSGANRSYRFATSDGVYSLNVWLAASGVLPVTDQNGTLAPAFTTPALPTAAQAYLDLLRTSSPHTRLTGYTREPMPDESVGPLSAGQVAFWLDATDRYGATGAITSTGTLLPLPQDVNALPNFTVALAGYISAQSTQPEACWQWLRFLSDQAALIPGSYPARTSQAATLAEPAASVYAAAAPALARTPASATDVFDDPQIDLFWFYRAIDRALQGKNLERELADAQVTTEAYLACVAGGGTGPACATQVDPAYAGLQRAGP